MYRSAFLVLLGSLLLVPASAAPPPPAGWIDGFVIANGIRIHYWRTGGDKPVMVMAHGSSDDALCWTNFAKEFTADYDIVMFDARGHGLTDPPGQNDPSDAQAEDLAALIRELKLTKPIVMGHSMGSASAAWFAAKYPDVARAIVLEDPFLGPRRTGSGAAGGGDREQRRAQILATNNKTEAELVAECIKGAPQWGRNECEIWAPSKHLHHPNTAYASVGARPAMSELFPKMTAPVLILKADADAAVRAENGKVAALLPNGKIVHIDGAGHNVRRDRKAETVAALRAFLRGL
ncbi:MAG: alpha/beta hydrolase [Bryobacterales bacterium]|nr:alpha/beta hydrolase [Bryobacterales bacterium]